MKLGSLFDGSGGFPLAGTINGITPVWASEIEPYPIAVTTARFPSMKHLGSITEISGGSIEPVDIITFGSPCQDLSIAGNQKGIESGERSSLFFQAVRIIKEMRDATNGVYPNYAVWENVPGAFSSNHGNDFRLVLEALASISDPTVSIPMPEKWQRSGEIVGDGYSIAWRTLDAQFWGVPQRRKRIYLVADFRGERAGQILFEREGVRGDTAQSREAGEGTAEDATGGASGSGGVRCLTPWDCQSKRLFAPDGVWPTLPAMGEGGANNSAVVYPINLQVITRHKALGRGTGFGAGEAGDAAYTLQAGHEHGVVYPIVVKERAGCPGGEKGALWSDTDFTLATNQDMSVVYPAVARTLEARHDSSPCIDRGQNIVCIHDKATRYQGGGDTRDNDGSGNGLGVSEDGVEYTLTAADRHGVAYAIEPGAAQRLNTESRIHENCAPTLRANMGDNQLAVVYSVECRNMCLNQELSGTLQSKENGGQSLNYQAPVVYSAGNGQADNSYLTPEVAQTLNCMHDQQIVLYETKPPRKYIVRRLTPTECARLQGFPDNWGDVDVKGKSHSDSAEYKMWGNGIALPCAVFVLGRIARVGEQR